MKIKFKPSIHTPYTLAGFFIQSGNTAHWVAHINQLHLPVNEITIHPISRSGSTLIWGCLVLCALPPNLQNKLRAELCQCLDGVLYFPANCIPIPDLNAADAQFLTNGMPSIFHPDAGWAYLGKALEPEVLFALPTFAALNTRQPASPVHIPHQILTLSIAPKSGEEIIKNLEEIIFPIKEQLKQDKLSFFEKIKLFFYQLLFGKSNKPKPADTRNSNTSPENQNPDKTNFIFTKLFKFNWFKKAMREYENLEERNKSEMEKLMQMLKSDPKNGLKYALPLDEQGTTRGESSGAFSLLQRWGNLGIFNNSALGGQGGGALNIGDYYYTLRQQYTQMAQDFINKGEYKEAAFVYMKLLKDYQSAAQTLEKGKFYAEAAAIYKLHVKNMYKAAECYENARLYDEAVNIYVELKMHEKAGDLFTQMGQNEKAAEQYTHAAKLLENNYQYLRASFIYEQKVGNSQLAKNILIRGWQQNRDAFNCLNNYLNYFPKPADLKSELTRLYQNEVNEKNASRFINVLKYEFAKPTPNKEFIRNLAYEIAVENLQQQPEIISELVAFNPKDKEFTKDVIRYKVKVNKT